MLNRAPVSIVSCSKSVPLWNCMALEANRWWWHLLTATSFFSRPDGVVQATPGWVGRILSSLLGRRKTNGRGGRHARRDDSPSQRRSSTYFSSSKARVFPLNKGEERETSSSSSQHMCIQTAWDGCPGTNPRRALVGVPRWHTSSNRVTLPHVAADPSRAASAPGCDQFGVQRHAQAMRLRSAASSRRCPCARWYGPSTAGVTIVVDGHEGGGTAVGGRALATKTGDLVVLINLVVLQDGELDLLVLVLLDLRLTERKRSRKGNTSGRTPRGRRSRRMCLW